MYNRTTLSGRGDIRMLAYSVVGVLKDATAMVYVGKLVKWSDKAQPVVLSLPLPATSVEVGGRASYIGCL